MHDVNDMCEYKAASAADLVQKWHLLCGAGPSHSQRNSIGSPAMRKNMDGLVFYQQDCVIRLWARQFSKKANCGWTIDSFTLVAHRSKASGTPKVKGSPSLLYFIWKRCREAHQVEGASPSNWCKGDCWVEEEIPLLEVQLSTRNPGRICRHRWTVNRLLCSPEWEL